MSSYFILLLAGILSACGGSGSNTSPGTGTLSAYLADAPACGYDQVNITVTKARVHQSSTATPTDAGWSEIVLNPARKINLLSLTNGVLDNLGKTQLVAGHYTQIRLELLTNNTTNLANTVLPFAGVETLMDIPTDIKLINGFDILPNQHTDLVLDIDACKSVIKRGNGTYALKPVIKTIPFALNGINGYVDPALRAFNVIISAQLNGTVIQSTSIEATSGAFFLARMTPGNYDVAITADGYTTAIITGVPVSSTTSIATISNSIQPVVLPLSVTHIVSGTENLNPASTTEVAFVTAKQIIGTTPIMTVKSTMADNTASGFYKMILPVNEPLLGKFNTGTLPIPLVTQSGVAGKYTLEATATGYQTQTVSMDISMTDATQNFILAP